MVGLHKSIYFSITIVSIILGLMVAMQFRFTSATESGVQVGREQDLAGEKRQIAKDNDLLREEVNDLTAKIEEAGKGHNEATVAMNSEFFKISSYAGLTDLSGPGVKVILDYQPVESQRYGANAVKDVDLLKIINDLRGAGAEAISINEQRVLATSEVREAGKHINVNLSRLASPYVVAAIGNATALKSSLEIKDGIIDDLRGRGISVVVEVKEGIFVPAFNGALRFDYAKPTQMGG